MTVSAADRAKRNSDAIELRRMGIPTAKIRDQLGLASIAATERAIAAGLAAVERPSDPLSIRRLELDRLDRLQSGVWAKAVKGDVAAIDRVLRLSEMRMKLAGIPDDNHTMRDAYDKTVDALHLDDVSAASIAAGRRVADQIDAATATGDALQVTKALYLIPHLMNVLDKLGATPMARETVDSIAREQVGVARENDLLKFRRDHGISS